MMRHLGSFALIRAALLVGAVVGSGWLERCGARAADVRRPNVLFLAADDLRPEMPSAGCVSTARTATSRSAAHRGPA